MQFGSVVDVVEVELMPYIVVGIAVVVLPEVIRVLWRENAGVGVEVEGQEPAVGDVVERMAPGVTGLHLKRFGHSARKFHREPVVVRHTGIRHFGDRGETWVDRSRRQPRERTYPQSGHARSRAGGLEGHRDTVAVRI